MDPVKLQSTFTPDFDREKGKAGSHRRDTFPKPFWAVKGKTKRFKRCFRCFWRFKRSLWGSVFGCLCGTRTVFVGQCLSSPALVQEQENFEDLQAGWATHTKDIDRL